MTVADSDGRLLLRTVLTCYPGGGSRYIRHIDNPNRNGRLLTAIYYLNLEWTEADGGTLRIFPPALTGAASATAAQPEPEPELEEEEPAAVVEPIGDRLLLFFSDTRCPHEVMPTHGQRYAITTWYSCAKERIAAVQRAASQEAGSAFSAEEERLRAEQAKFAT